jgi:hypothetical protein
VYEKIKRTFVDTPFLEKSFQKIINQFYLVGKPKIKVVPVYLKMVLRLRYWRFDRNHMPKE